MKREEKTSWVVRIQEIASLTEKETEGKILWDADDGGMIRAAERELFQIPPFNGPFNPTLTEYHRFMFVYIYTYKLIT